MLISYFCSYELKGCDVIWAIKDSSITSTFVDAGAAQFFLPTLLNEDPRQNNEDEGATICKRLKYGLGCLEIVFFVRYIIFRSCHFLSIR